MTSNGKISKPVNVTDVGLTIGSGSRNVGYLCSNKHGLINPWAKYKPVKQNWSDHREGYWKAMDGQCGYKITVYTSIGTTTSGFIKDLIDETNKWEYDPPIGNTTPFRLLDFDGYNHNSENPVGEISGNTIYVDSSGACTIQYDKIIVKDDNLQPSDIIVDDIALSEWYLGVILIKGNTYLVATSTDKMGSSDYSIKLTEMSGKIGEYTAYPFLSTVKITQSSSIPTGKFISFPHSFDIINIKKEGSLRYIEPQGTWNKTHTTITSKGICHNDSNIQYTFSGIVIYIIRTNSPSDKPETGTIISTHNLANSVTVGATSVGETLSVIDNISNYNSSYTYWVGAKATNIDIAYTPVEEDISED